MNLKNIKIDEISQPQKHKYYITPTYIEIPGIIKFIQTMNGDYNKGARWRGEK